MKSSAEKVYQCTGGFYKRIHQNLPFLATELNARPLIKIMGKVDYKEKRICTFSEDLFTHAKLLLYVVASVFWGLLGGC